MCKFIDGDFVLCKTMLYSENNFLHAVKEFRTIYCKICEPLFSADFVKNDCFKYIFTDIGNDFTWMVGSVESLALAGILE